MQLPFRLSLTNPITLLPLQLYSAGAHEQSYQSRPNGYPVMQCFITFAGCGQFDFLGGPSSCTNEFTPVSPHDAVNIQQTVVLGTNEAMLIQAGQAHQYAAVNEEPWVVGYLGISGGAVQSIVENCGLPIETPISLHNGRMLEEPLREIWEIADGAKPKQMMQASRLLYDFLLLLTENRMHAEVLPRLANKHPCEPLQRATELMYEHFCEPLLISNLATAVGYSVQHFQRLFQKAYGLSPHTYLQRLRMQQAALWIEKQPDLSVSELAGRFNWEPHYFIHVFKRVYGLTPGQYKQKLHFSGTNASKL